MARNPSGRGPIKALLIVLMILMIAATGLVLYLCINLVTQPQVRPQEPTAGNVITFPTQPETEPPETTLPEPETVVSTATVGAMGDILMHLPVINTGKQGDGSYNFDSIFKYVKDYIEPLDYAAANLETTLASDDNGYPYKGFPNFNCPDEIVDGAKNAGFDAFLTANNHCYDTGSVGYHRTLSVVREKGLDVLGTHDTEEEPRYLVQDVNGIKIGMICYTYNTRSATNGTMSLNGLPLKSQDRNLVNTYDPNNVSAFYSELEGHLENMKAEGAEATVVFMHWGPQEYALSANDLHKAMSQKMCDMGVDVIIGGHPHVVQPMDLVESTVDPDHKTVVLYSMGNAVSNQRKGNLTQITTAHTEDGALITVTFEKYSDGKVYLRYADVIPTWVNMHGSGSSKEYNILPLDAGREDEWKDLFGLDGDTLEKASASHARTWELVGEGLQKCQDYLEQAKLDREQYYHDLAFFPERFEAEDNAA